MRCLVPAKLEEMCCWNCFEKGALGVKN